MATSSIMCTGTFIEKTKMYIGMSLWLRNMDKYIMEQALVTIDVSLLEVCVDPQNVHNVKKQITRPQLDWTKIQFILKCTGLISLRS